MGKTPVWELVALEEKREALDELLAQEEKLEPDEFYALAKAHREKMRREYLKDEDIEGKALSAIEHNIADMTVEEFLSYRQNKLLCQILRCVI